MQAMLKPSLNWLLVFLPVAVWAEHAQPDSHRLIFVAAALAIIPLAGILGLATEHLAARAGEGLGGLLNATFGNAAELIIAIVALQGGQLDLVKASLTGSIIGNVLLVLGAAFFAGGLRHSLQEYNALGVQTQSATLSIAAVGLIVPAAFHNLGAGIVTIEIERQLSLTIAVILLAVYVLMLIFSLRTHVSLFSGSAEENTHGEAAHEAPWSVAKALLYLLGASALIAWMSEILVGSVEQAAHAMGMSQIFVGMIVVAVVGNAAEHSTAILMALRNRMNLSIGIAVGSSTQIALFVAPLLVLLSYVIADQPMDLVFTRGEILFVILSTFLLSEVTVAGKSTWFEGVLLLAVYGIFAAALYFIP
jgi:Ca2+:H+ antiporter